MCAHVSGMAEGGGRQEVRVCEGVEGCGRGGRVCVRVCGRVGRMYVRVCGRGVLVGVLNRMKGSSRGCERGCYKLAY